jgi:hypothetical protein
VLAVTFAGFLVLGCWGFVHGILRSYTTQYIPKGKTRLDEPSTEDGLLHRALPGGVSQTAVEDPLG